MAVNFAVGYSTAVPKLRRSFLSDRYFFITVRLLQRRTNLTEQVPGTAQVVGSDGVSVG